MTNHSSTELRQFYLDYLRDLISHPQFFGGFLFDSEANLLGVESLAIFVNTPIKSYRDFLNIQGFGANTFVSQFCVESRCSIALLDKENSIKNSDALVTSFVSKMRVHLIQYANWRGMLPKTQLEQFYSDYLELLTERPPFLAQQPMFTEAHLRGIDMLASFLSGKTMRSYRDYLTEQNFGSFTFEIRFCRENDSRLVLFAKDGNDNHDELRSKFKVQQSEHFQLFYDWLSVSA